MLSEVSRENDRRNGTLPNFTFQTNRARFRLNGSPVPGAPAGIIVEILPRFFDEIQVTVPSKPLRPLSPPLGDAKVSPRKPKNVQELFFGAFRDAYDQPPRVSLNRLLCTKKVGRRQDRPRGDQDEKHHVTDEASLKRVAAIHKIKKSTRHQ